MSIPVNEQIPLAAAADTLPRVNGKKVHISTLWRWCHKGSRGITLDYIRMGSRIMTSEAALARFFDDRTAVDHQPAPVGVMTRRRTSAQRERAVSTAKAELSERGLK